MSLESITAILSYTQDILNSTTKLFDRSSNKSLGERMQSAGVSLFNGACSTDIARRVAGDTGNFSPYIAKFAAGGNSAEALANTLECGTMIEQLYHPWGFGFMSNLSFGGAYSLGMPFYGSGLMCPTFPCSRRFSYWF